MAVGRRPRPRSRTTWIVRGRYFAASVSLVALILAVLAAGQRYFYCPAMDRSAFVACCDHAEQSADVPDHPAISEHAECCEARNLEANAPYGPHQAPPQLFAPLVAILPALFFLPDFAIVEPPLEALAEIRAGPSPGEARAALQVYLC